MSDKRKLWLNDEMDRVEVTWRGDVYATGSGWYIDHCVSDYVYVSPLGNGTVIVRSCPADDAEGDTDTVFDIVDDGVSPEELLRKRAPSARERIENLCADLTEPAVAHAWAMEDVAAELRRILADWQPERDDA